MRLLLFVVTGLGSGTLCWWLLYLMPEELHFFPYAGLVYPGVVLAMALLVLGKVLGVVPIGKGGKAAGILVASAVLARGLGLETFHAQSVLFEYPPYQHILDFYQQSSAGALVVQDYAFFPFFWLPSPIAGGLQAFILSLGLTFAWQVPEARSKVVTQAAIYGALLALLPPFLLHVFPDHLAEIVLAGDQSPFSGLSWLLDNMALIISPLLWHLLLALALYLALGPLASSVPSLEKTDDEAEVKKAAAFRCSDYSQARVSTPDAMAMLHARTRAVKRVSWLLLVAGMFFVGGVTRSSYLKATGLEASTLASQQMLVQEYVASHPLHNLWSALKGCGGGLRTMSDVLSAREVGEVVKTCEAGVLGRLDGEHKGWQETLDKAAGNLPVIFHNELLVRDFASDSPAYAFWSALAMCDATYDPAALRQEILSGEPLSEYRTRRWDCIKGEMQDYVQKMGTEGGESQLEFFISKLLEEEGLWRLGGSGEYFYLRPHKVWQEGPGDGWEYWDDYRQMEDDGYTPDRPPSGSFLKALNRAWESGEAIRPVDQPDEMRPYAHRDMQLITPIVVDGQTQGILLSEMSSGEMAAATDDELQVYYRIGTVALVFLIIFFLVFQHHTLATIPIGMDLMRWRPGLWHPSLVLLHRSSDFHHRHLFNIMIFMIFIPPFFYIGEALIGACALLLPMIFAVIALPRVVADYRLFARGIPVPCKKVDTTVESVFARAGLAGVSEARYAVTTYEADYQGKQYLIEATYNEEGRGPLVALIDPDRGERGLLLNAFCEK